jgi:hypothetical protein
MTKKKNKRYVRKRVSRWQKRCDFPRGPRSHIRTGYGGGPTRHHLTETDTGADPTTEHAD